MSSVHAVLGGVQPEMARLKTNHLNSISNIFYSNVTLILCHRAVNKVDARKFPSGKARLENAGNIAFCFLMTAVSLVLIVLSIMELVEGKKDVSFHYPSVIAVGVAFATKLALFTYCWSLRNKYSQVRILWEVRPLCSLSAKA